MSSTTSWSMNSAKRSKYSSPSWNRISGSPGRHHGAVPWFVPSGAFLGRKTTPFSRSSWMCRSTAGFSRFSFLAISSAGAGSSRRILGLFEVGQLANIRACIFEWACAASPLAQRFGDPAYLGSRFSMPFRPPFSFSAAAKRPRQNRNGFRFRRTRSAPKEGIPGRPQPARNSGALIMGEAD